MPNEGNPRLILRLDPLIRAGLRARAMSRGVSLNELAKFVLVKYVKQSAEAKEGTPALLRHLDTLVRTLRLQATRGPNSSFTIEKAIEVDSERAKVEWMPVND